MPSPSSLLQWPAGAVWPLLGLVLGHALAGELPPVSNVVMGGAEKRCSSFTGRGPSAECTADWDTILKEDPALQGLRMEDLLFEADYPEPLWTYSLNAASLQALRDTPNALFRGGHKAALIAQLQAVMDYAPISHQTWASLEAAIWPPAQGKALGMSPSEWSVLRNALVDAMVLPARKIQARSTRFSSNAASTAGFETFVTAARAIGKGKTPLVGVVTASGGPHAFVDRDINVMALRSAGAEVVYLPLDGGFRQALDANDCNNLHYYYDSYANLNAERPVHHSHLLFPDLAQQQREFCESGGARLNAVLGQLQGIYFSGGNQARHLESLVTRNAQGQYLGLSPQWQIIQSRHAQGQLVVAGTSAGNHIQGGGLWRSKPVPMIGGGDAYPVLKSGYAFGTGPAGDKDTAGQADSQARYAAVLYPLGGLGVFRYGVLDSHFSRRAREARLLRATAESGMDYGFGVDENTALVVRQADRAGTTHFSVVGAGGIFIADVRQARFETAPDQSFRIQGVVAHYLRPGDRASIDATGHLQVHLDESQAQRAIDPNAAPVTVDRLLDYGYGQVRKLAMAMGAQGASQAWGSTQGSRDQRSVQDTPFYSLTLHRRPDTVFRAANANTDSPTALSYTQLDMAFAPCSGPCKPPWMP